MLKYFAADFAKADGLRAMLRLALLRNSSPRLCGYGNGVVGPHAPADELSASSLAGPLSEDLDAVMDLDEREPDGDLDSNLFALGMSVTGRGTSLAFIAPAAALAARDSAQQVVETVVEELRSRLRALLQSPRFRSQQFLHFDPDAHLSAATVAVPHGVEDWLRVDIARTASFSSGADGKSKEAKHDGSSGSGFGVAVTPAPPKQVSPVHLLHEDLAALASLEWLVALLVKLMKRPPVSALSFVSQAFLEVDRLCRFASSCFLLVSPLMLAFSSLCITGRTPLTLRSPLRVFRVYSLRAS